MSTEAEGFICPYCLVGFGTSSKLQGHFVEMHSGQGALDEVDYINGEEEVRSSSVRSRGDLSVLIGAMHVPVAIPFNRG